MPQQLVKNNRATQLAISGDYQLGVIPTEVDSLRDQRNRTPKTSHPMVTAHMPEAVPSEE